MTDKPTHPIVPEHPIEDIGAIKPEHPIAPGKPEHKPGTPTHPIVEPPKPTEPPKPAHPIVATIAEKRLAEIKASQARDKAACFVKINAHLVSAGLESNIGQNSDYWGLLNEYRSYE